MTFEMEQSSEITMAVNGMVRLGHEIGLTADEFEHAANIAMHTVRSKAQPEKATFGQRVREHRSRRELSQRKLADIIGVSTSSVNMYERDEREPSFRTLGVIADFFGVSTGYLLGRTDKADASATSPQR